MASRDEGKVDEIRQRSLDSLFGDSDTDDEAPQPILSDSESDSEDEGSMYDIGDKFSESGTDNDAGVWIVVETDLVDGGWEYTILNLVGVFMVISEEDLGARGFRHNPTQEGWDPVPIERFRISDVAVAAGTELFDTWDELRRWVEQAQRNASSLRARVSARQTRFALGDIFRQRDATGDASVWIIIYNVPASENVYFMLSLTASIVTISETRLEAQFRYDPYATGTIPLERFQVSDETLQEQTGLDSWESIRQRIQSARGNRTPGHPGSSAEHIPRRPRKRGADEAWLAQKATTRRKKWNTNYTTSDMTDLVDAIQTIGEIMDLNTITAKQQQAKDVVIRQASNIFLQEVPMVGGPRWPEYTLGDIFGEESYLLIGGGRLDPQGAAAEGERYYDFLRTDGSLLRCRESEVPDRVDFLNQRQMTSADTYRLQIRDFRLFLDLEDMLVRQHEIIVRSTNDLFYEIGESQMLGRVFDGSDARDAAADAEIQRVQNLLREAEEAAQKAAEEKRKEIDTQWFKENWLAKLQKDQKRRGIAHMIKTGKKWKTTTEVEALEKKCIVDPEYCLNDNCMICLDPVDEPVDEDGNVVGKPVRLNCGHCFHEKCIKDFQAPKFNNNNTYQNPRLQSGHLVMIDTLKCPICRKPTLDPSFGDGIFRLKKVTLRF